MHGRSHELDIWTDSSRAGDGASRRVRKQPGLGAGGLFGRLAAALSGRLSRAHSRTRARDYLGLPINEAARQFADSWDPSRITLPEEQCRVHVSPYIYRGPTNLRIWEEKDPKTQDADRDQALHQHLRADAHDLDGRPAASRSERGAHLDGILDRPLRRRHAGRRDHAPEAGVGPPQRPADERPGAR